MTHVLTTGDQIAQYPYSPHQLRRDNPGTSFPRQIPDALAAEFGVFPVTVADKPAHTPAQVAERDAAPTPTGGAWVLGWTVRDMTAEEQAQEFTARQSEMRQRIRSAYSAAMRPISEAYPQEEREGWPEQIQAAKAVIAGETSALIDALAAPRGLTASEMASRVLQKQAEYRVVYGTMTANLHRLAGLVDAAATASDLEHIDVASGWDLPAA